MTAPAHPRPLPGGAAGSRLAAVTLVALALAAPWAFGAVAPRPLLFVIAAGLLAAAVALALGVLRGRAQGVALPAVACWPLVAFLALALAQLLPLPDAAHRRLAPGSWAVWRPAEPAAAAVLGEAARPISIDPQTTLRGVALVAALGLLALLAAPALAHRRAATLAIGAVALGGFALSVYAILARDRFGPLLYGTLPVPTVRPFGPFVNENHFAGWTAMAALLVAGLRRRPRRRRPAAWPRLDREPARRARRVRDRHQPRDGAGRPRLALARRRARPSRGGHLPARASRRCVPVAGPWPSSPRSCWRSCSGSSSCCSPPRRPAIACAA